MASYSLGISNRPVKRTSLKDRGYLKVLQGKERPMFFSYRFLVRYSLGACLFILASILGCPLHSWGESLQAPLAKVDVIHSLDRYPADGAYPILLKISLPPLWYIHGTKAGREGLIPTTLSFPDLPGLKVGNIRFPPPEKKKFEYTHEPVEVFSKQFLVQAELTVNPKATPGRHLIEGKLSYQPCSSRYCLPPQSIPVSISLLVTSRESHAKAQNQTMFNSKERDSAAQGPFPGWRMDAGLWLTLLGIFLGGLALNLTPCIYPLIPITVSYFGGRGEKVFGKTVIHGLLYISGLAFTNSILGLAASLSGGLLGSALQSPIVLMVVAGILVSLALSFFGLWEFRIPSALMRIASRNFGGYFGAFFMGLTLGIVAAPCIGPFILGLLTYVGQKGDLFLGFIYFFVLSIGLGLPLSILAIFSGALERLPVSGEWMVWIRKLLGWVLVGMAGYLIQPLVPGPTGKSAILAAVLIGAGFHLGWLDRNSRAIGIFQYTKKILGVLLIAGAIILFAVKPPAGQTVNWVPYNEAVLAEAAEQKRPVILEFYADWCTPCKALDKNVFTDPAVIGLSRDFVTVRVDLTKRHPSQEELQRRYQVRGVPTIIFIDRRGREERALRIESYVNREEVLKRMKTLIETSRA
ncbi:MAG: cytochrome c biogenesis protein CcdA [Pseudomonadota bacterium]